MGTVPRRGRSCGPPPVWAASLALALLSSATVTPLAAQGRRSPAPPPSTPTIYDPDPLSCQAEAIREAFERHLEPFADQSPAVIARLRTLQGEMTASSLRRCVAKGLMQRDEANALYLELMAPASSSAPPATAQPGSGSTLP
ncbi:hypothetical protein [Cyanobium sp. LEGE 06113]|uniref:hypothetical protein n=1 Tax=Cyanobium sp. LEGE 06113 TaxID=1297573 RepID=UPI00187F66D6|nr:hypothetical protein [Cyanobium sp. LEGE 06113]MBE9153530.1 hypothetical protein [Cyanobium sp. LEGE 06113]